MSEPETEAPVVIPAEAPAPEATPVVAQTPSSAAKPEAPSFEERVIKTVEEAVGVLIDLVKDHRRAGDADVENALADVHAAIAAKK